MAPRISYYQSALSDFLLSEPSLILGDLTRAHGFELDNLQRDAWLSQVDILKAALNGRDSGTSFLNSSFPAWGNALIL